jgi:hypothetical protein
VNNYLKEMEADFATNSLMPPEVLRFFVARLIGNLSSGAKFEKNDVLDLLLVYSLTVSNTLFVTNDKDVRDAMKDVNRKSYDLSLSLWKK